MDNQPEDSPQREVLRGFENSIREYWPVAPFVTAVDVWRAVRRIISNGPGMSPVLPVRITNSYSYNGFNKEYGRIRDVSGISLIKGEGFNFEPIERVNLHNQITLHHAMLGK
jgi:hypothetical protein